MIRNGLKKNKVNIKFAFDIFNVGSNTTFYIDWCRVFLTRPSIVTAAETPGGAGCPSGTENRRETIGKLVTVVAPEVVFSIPTAVVSRTPFDATET